MSVFVDEHADSVIVQLPQDITKVLDIIKLASRVCGTPLLEAFRRAKSIATAREQASMLMISQVMSAFFLTGACLSFVLIFIKPLMKYSRWIAFGVAFLGFINVALVLIATVVATVMFVIMQNVFRNADQVNIEPKLGNVMFAMIWTASAFALFSWAIDLALMCCCASRRDVRSGRKRGSRKAYT